MISSSVMTAKYFDTVFTIVRTQYCYSLFVNGAPVGEYETLFTLADRISEVIGHKKWSLKWTTPLIIPQPEV